MTMLPGLSNAAEVENVNGAGASFPYPIYAKWATKYHQYSGLKLSYQSIGSGGGIAQIKAKTVDFGASDEPLKSEELEKDGLLQFPLIMGGVVPVINLENVYKGKLKLTPELLADIYLGKIKNWNDRRIMAVNPDLRLPDQEITVVHRADGSGTTWIFTNYLTKISTEWKEKIGGGKSVSWPTGVGGKGNEGVSALVKKTQGSIGYVEYAYALRERLKYVQIQNSAGKFVAPTIESFQAAAANADWEKAPGFYMVLTDQPGDKSWPITGASYILVYRDQPDPSKAEAMLKFFDWCFKSGSEQAVELHYVPMPTKVCNLVKSLWAKEITSGGQPVWK
ncbi:MAG: phosphate ABC transporter substrate-binding protein PstS [Desulfomonile tiedjei]|uniref:Phosphate-binding protein n=1 Tax=Desulfomonile tiedjei TaxID=2358 RepID=A0A9D6V2B1_9BACT|nr:phosphate ABC transporter substrate-binding protein PstS [Desulfomonile tiedjei]